MTFENELIYSMRRNLPYHRAEETKNGLNWTLWQAEQLKALLNEINVGMRRAETAMLRMANDQYRKVIFNSQVYYNSGAGTYEKAVDMATKDFLSRGINCIQYKNGARVNIASYAGMALRTANTRAYCQGEGAKRQEWGITTVIVNKRGLPCPKCGRWTGKILIDDVWSGGKASDGPYPLMSQAMAGGLYHPNCKDGHSTYFPGISEKPEKVTKKEMKQAVVAEQQENRRNLIQRNIDKFDRLSNYSLDEENQKIQIDYRLKFNKWDNVVVETEGNDIIRSVAVSGARKPDGKVTREHAKKYYDLVRSMSADVSKIANTIGYSEEQIQEIKNFMFMDKHDLGGTDLEYFEPDYMTEESWKRLIQGNPQSHDLTLIKYEIMEKELMKEGYSQREARNITSKTYNYSDEASKFYDKIKEYKKE